MAATTRADAERAWRALAPLIAGQPRVRLSKDGGKTYPTAGERRLAEKLPTQPAAVRLCGTDGAVPTIALDLDTSKGGQCQVDADYRDITTWLRRRKALWIEDQAPTGGRHIYLPLLNRVGFTEARHFVEALALRHPSLDPGPHRSADVGCIRPPGSPHKRGGYQKLTMTLSDAYEAAVLRNDRSIWTELQGDLAPELETVTQRRSAPLILVEESEYLPLPAGPRNIPAEKNRLARTGLYDAARFNSPSEARQSVLASAAAAGWRLTDVQKLMHQNVWAGMNAFYARYSPQQRAAALTRDWNKALGFVTAHRKNRTAADTGTTHAHKSYTSLLNTQGGLPSPLPPGAGDEHRFLNQWRLAREDYEHRLKGTRSGLWQRLLLRALEEAARKRGTRYIEFGVRSLALSTGIHHTTVAKQLKELATGSQAVIRLTLEGRGIRADQYELVIPTGLTRTQETRTWRAGKVHALRPAFRALGITSSFVFEALELHREGLSTQSIIEATALSPAAVSSALEILAAWNLVAKNGSQWLVTATTSLKAIAEYLGVLEAVHDQSVRYQHERTIWRRWLETRAAAGTVHLAAVDEPYPYWENEGPPENDYTLMSHVLRRTLHA